MPLLKKRREAMLHRESRCPAKVLAERRRGAGLVTGCLVSGPTSRAARTFLAVTILMATAVGYLKGEHAMLVVLSVGTIAFLYAGLENLRDDLDKLRDELRRVRR